MTLADRLGDPAARFNTAMMLATTLLEQGVPTDPYADFAAAATVAAKVREPFMQWLCAYQDACREIVHGNLDRAERSSAHALHLARSAGMPEAEPAHEQQLFLIRWHQGRLSEMLDDLRARKRAPALAARWVELAYAEAVCGDPEHARRLLRDAADDEFDMFYGAPWLGGMCLWADVAAELREPRAAAMLYPRLAPWEHLFATAGPLPIHGVGLALARLATVLDEHEAADRHFCAAMTRHRSLPSPFYEAETAVHWGCTLLDRDPGRALELLTEAAGLAARHSFQEVRRRALRAPCA
jgi:hypothetical protein